MAVIIYLERTIASRVLVETTQLMSVVVFFPHGDGELPSVRVVKSLLAGIIVEGNVEMLTR